MRERDYSYAGWLVLVCLCFVALLCFGFMQRSDERGQFRYTNVRTNHADPYSKAVWELQSDRNLDEDPREHFKRHAELVKDLEDFLNQR